MFKPLLVLAAAAVALAAPASAQQGVASQDVRVYASEITSFSFNDATMDVPLNQIDVLGRLSGVGQTSLSLSTNVLIYKITGQLVSDYSADVQLNAQLDLTGLLLPATVGTPARTLTASAAQDLAVGLSPLSASNVVLRYTASAPLSVGTDFDETRTVLLTLVATGVGI